MGGAFWAAACLLRSVAQTSQENTMSLTLAAQLGFGVTAIPLFLPPKCWSTGLSCQAPLLAVFLKGTEPGLLGRTEVRAGCQDTQGRGVGFVEHGQLPGREHSFNPRQACSQDHFTTYDAPAITPLHTPEKPLLGSRENTPGWCQS